jgi:plasmid maintenance system antidote protein VapI
MYRVTLSRLTNGRHGVSAGIAVRLAKAIGGSAEFSAPAGEP